MGKIKNLFTKTKNAFSYNTSSANDALFGDAEVPRKPVAPKKATRPRAASFSSSSQYTTSKTKRPQDSYSRADDELFSTSDDDPYLSGNDGPYSSGDDETNLSEDEYFYSSEDDDSCDGCAACADLRFENWMHERMEQAIRNHIHEEHWKQEQRERGMETEDARKREGRKEKERKQREEAKKRQGKKKEERQSKEKVAGERKDEERTREKEEEDWLREAKRKRAHEDFEIFMRAKAAAEQRRREQEAGERAEAEERARRRQAREEQGRVEELRERMKASRSAANPGDLYKGWKTACDAAFKRGGIVHFPHLPNAACTCAEPACIIRKQERSLKACEHDIEKLLRGSGQYSHEWLKKQSHQWHPDRFGRRCDEDWRERLNVKATEMYTIFQTLMEKERR